MSVRSLCASGAHAALALVAAAGAPPRKNVGKALIRLGSWSSAADAPDPKSALLIQDGPGGPILAAARL
jgi:hypothetical protein